jgi:hypothetical protein
MSLACPETGDARAHHWNAARFASDIHAIWRSRMAASNAEGQTIVRKANHRQRRGIDDAPAACREQLAQQIAHARLVLEHFSVACLSALGKRHEELEPDEAARPLRRVRQRIEGHRCVADLSGCLAGMYVTSERKAWATLSRCLQKNMPHPMGTESHLCASQVMESASSMPARCLRRLGRNDSSAAIGRVGMEPKPLPDCRSSPISASGIDHAGGCRAGVADHHEGQQALSRDPRPRGFQFFDIHLQSAVRSDYAQIPPSKPHHVRDLVEAVMRFLGEINRGFTAKAAQAVFAVFREPMRQCDHHCR